MAAGIDRLIAAARSAGHAHEVVDLGKASEWPVRQAAAAGIDIAAMTHAADTSAIRHILSRHGNEAAERALGQLPIVKPSCARSPLYSSAQRGWCSD